MSVAGIIRRAGPYSVPLLALLIPLLATAVRPLAAQTRHDVIQGRVTTDSGVAIRGADVVVTIAPSAATVLGETDSAGAYRVAIPNGTGEYLLYIGALGRKPFRQRVTMTAADSVAVVNAKLASAVETMATVRVQARKARPTRSLGADNNSSGLDATDKRVDGVTGALPPDLATNLDAMATLIPGLSVTGGGVSAFGMGPDANMPTVNGLAFNGGDLPRDLQTSTRFITSPWDPTRGGFSGVLTSRTIASGGNISRKSGHVTLDAPMLQTGDAVAEQFGQKFTNLALSEGGSGAFVIDKLYYNYGISASRRAASVASLLDLNATALTHAGVSPDSAARLLQLLAQQGVPLTLGGVPSDRVTNSVTVAERIDHQLPRPPNDGVPAPNWWTTAIASYSESGAQALSPTITPATAGKSTNATGALQGFYSRYFGPDGDYLNETTSAFNIAHSSGAPYLALPGGDVLIASTLATGAAGDGQAIGNLSFGGNSALLSDNTNWIWQADNQTDFLLHDNTALPMKLYLSSRLDGYHQSLAANRLGTFSFASLNDLANGVPSSFSRTLNAPDQSGGEWMGAAALGGNWNTRKLVLTGGARLDANVFTAAPANNPAVAELFGQRTDHAPNSIAVSPRFGFNWYYTARGGWSQSMSSLSNIYRGGPQVRGGIGEFRSYLPSTLLANALTSTGLPGGTEQLLCTGPAAPSPDWQTFITDPETIPNTCLGGATAFADTAPAVQLFDRNYTAPRSWRATLGWTSTVKNIYLAVDAAYSLNLNQPGTVDLNFAGTPRFTLADEGNRPVFVPSSSIVTSTGAVSATDARLSTAFGQVSDRVSDLRGDARQLSIYSIPNIPYKLGTYILSYTYTDARAQARGFDQSTAGDPRAIEWAPSAYSFKHQFQLQGARDFFKSKLGVTAFVRILSGLRYTPMVAGDVNGDGLSYDDRAFVFDPARTADTALANGLHNLLTNGSSSARTCLARALGQIAGRNSCATPWSATMNASIVYEPALPHTDKRAHVSLALSNPLGGLDQLLHGPNHLHGWGATPSPDATLYQVRGFDPNAQRFLYTVNSRFGNTSPAVTTLRTPFRVTLDVSLDLGHSYEEQDLALKLRMRPPLAGTRAPADSLRKRYMQQNYEDIYGIVLRLADSLALSREQMEQVQQERTVLAARADSIYGALAIYLAALPSSYDAKTAVKRVDDADDAVWKAIYAERPFLVKLLTPGQIHLLPGPFYQLVTNPNANSKWRFFGF